MMKKLLLIPIVLLIGGLVFAQRGDLYGTRALQSLEQALSPSGTLRFPNYAADPFGCAAGTEGSYYGNTATNLAMYCDGTTWTSILTGPAAGLTDNTIPVWNTAGLAFEDSLLTDDATTVTAAGPIALPDGVFGAPALTSTTTPTSGLYWSDTEARWAIDGNAPFRITRTGVAFANGTAAAPSAHFINSVDSGLYYIGAAHIGFSMTGALVMDWEDTNAASAGADLVTISSTLEIMDDVTDIVGGVVIELTNVDHTGGNVYGIDVRSLLGTGADANATESAVHIRSGWDTGIDLAEPTNGGNADEQNQFQGLIKIATVSLGVMTDGTDSILIIDDDPAAEWTATANVTVDEDAAILRKGATSLGIVWAGAAVNGNGADNPLAGDANWEAFESVGMWWRCDIALTAGDIIFVTTDNPGGDVTFNFPAIAAADVDIWTWIEIDISGLAGGTGDAVSDISIVVSAAGASTATDCNFDLGYVWDLADEEALGQDIITDGILSVLTVTTDQAQPNTLDALVQDTGYFIHYESGNDFIVNLANNSAESGIALVVYQ